MLKRAYFVVIFLTAITLTGCATTRKNSQSDIDALSARLTALQGQLSSKEQEILALQSRLDEERDARRAAEAALRDVELKRLSQTVKKSDSDLK